MKGNIVSVSKIFLTAGLLSAVAIQAGATGYEQSIEWSGRYGSVAGIGVSAAGAEALYFNPAGLAKGATGNEVSFNLSPQFPTSSGPYTTDYENLSSNTPMGVTGGLLYNYNLTPDLGFGIGAYVGAGVNSNFDNVQWAGFSSNTKLHNSLAVQEIALGAGYQIIPGLKVGGALRASFINAEVAGAGLSALPAALGGGKLLTYTDHQSLADRQIGGYNLGVQFSPSKSWGLGLDYRSKVDFFTKGSTTASYEIQGNSGALNGSKGNLGTASSTTVSSSLPELWTLGGFYNISDTWHLLAEADMAKYSQDQRITISGTLTYPGLGALPIPAIQQGLNDQFTYRIGAEYAGWDWPVRFGFIYQTISESTDYSNPATFAPGNNMTVTVGTGHKVMDSMTVDGGLAYSSDTVSIGSGVTAKAGDYASKDIALHLGLTYLF